LAAAKIFDEHIEMEAAPLARALPLNFPGLPYHQVIRHSARVEAALVAWARKEGAPARADNLMSILANSVDEFGAPAGDRATLNHLPTLFAAAFETSQAALTWVLFLLAQHPAAAEALLEELSALPDDSCERLVESKGLDAVTRESLRLLPIVPMLTRRAVRNTDLVDCNVAAGAYVVLSPFLTNRMPGLYPEPDRFLPERWDSVAPSQFEYLAFGAGPRTCIGSWFASSFLRIAVGRIMRRFRLQVMPFAKIDQRVRLTLKPGPGGVPVTIHPQDGKFRASSIRGNILQLVKGVGSRAPAHSSV
jgi:cytochrome P450